MTKYYTTTTITIAAHAATTTEQLLLLLLLSLLVLYLCSRSFSQLLQEMVGAIGVEVGAGAIAPPPKFQPVGKLFFRKFSFTVYKKIELKIPHFGEFRGIIEILMGIMSSDGNSQVSVLKIATSSLPTF